MGFHNDLGKSNGELLVSCACPCCGVGALRFYPYSNILALDKTTVCDRCGSVFSELKVDTKEERIIGGTKSGNWRRNYCRMLFTDGDVEYEESDPYFEPLAEPIRFGE